MKVIKIPYVCDSKYYIELNIIIKIIIINK